MISFKSYGDWGVTTSFLDRCKKSSYKKVAKKYGSEGVSALADATPVRSGTTAKSWGVDIQDDSSGLSITWTNTNKNKNLNIAVLIDQGHYTRTKGYVPPVNYIEPAITPIIEEATDRVWEEVIDG